ncbi:CHAT domain-containing protein (plasmid) [Nostoc sp. C057]|uniref:CHAT domain-containing protein n=1 Tax=Nostoc sp. C057 TaxID=2576903 RepID=UPI0015C39B2F|nr:CHAT domain-containing protein [Nostoc sp. C057]QLE52680.1 CHAT domain-containing protein [Nostoc sp. C057]
MISLQSCFKYLFSGILGLSLILIQSSSPAQTVKKEKEFLKNQAVSLTSSGHEQLALDRADEALKTWQESTKIYRQLNDKKGITESLINQNLAFQALGLHKQACNTLLEALNFNTNIGICDTTLQQPALTEKEQLTTLIGKQEATSVNLLGLQNLGEVLRILGKLNESETVLQETLTLAKLVSSSKISGIYLSLGNIEQTIYQQLQDKYSWIEEPLFREQIANIIPQKAQKSLWYYQTLENIPNISKSAKLQAQLNHLTLLISWEKWLSHQPNQANLHQKVNQQIRVLVNQIDGNSSAFLELSPEPSIHARLNFANNLSQIPDEQLKSVAIRYAKLALKMAETINSIRWLSYSFGTLGKLSTQTEQKQAYFTKALGFAQSIRASDIAYQWQQQLGLIYQKQGKTELAIQNYNAALANMTQVRDSLLSSNGDLQLSFQEEMEPTYRNYMRLLLASPSPDLKKVIQINEGLQIARLENFLRCGKLDLVALNQLQNLKNVPSVINIIDLEDTIEIIVQSPDGSLHHHSVDSKLVRFQVNQLLEALQGEKLININENAITDYSQKIYEYLITPIKRYIPSSGTLVFTLDKSFQSIPMGLLYDGRHYLIEHYSIAETLDSRVRQPRVLHENQMIALIAGLSKISPSYIDKNAPKNMENLPPSKQEVENVEKQTKSSVALLDDKFTLKRFKEELTQNNFPIVHITTHGQFSSDPLKTVLVAYDKLINIRDFDSLIRGKTENSQDAIELLVLSACETAKGNKQSAMGIAGIAAQAGARSTVATLWRVDANSTALLMQEFYRGLNNGLPKAEALRQAQLSLLSNPQYQKSYYWAPFLLVGSWL